MFDTAVFAVAIVGIYSLTESWWAVGIAIGLAFWNHIDGWVRARWFMKDKL